MLTGLIKCSFWRCTLCGNKFVITLELHDTLYRMPQNIVIKHDKQNMLSFPSTDYKLISKYWCLELMLIFCMYFQIFVGSSGVKYRIFHLN